MKINGKKVFVGLEKLEKREKRQRNVIKKRLDAGRTIQLDLSTKAQLLTIILSSEGEDTLTRSLIIEDDQKLRIVLIAAPFAPRVLMYVSIVENP